MYRASIEILPGGLKEWAPQASDDFPFVLHEGHLGIPQKVLYKLYMVAISLCKVQADNATVPDLLSIIVLANPAHQTALNARKKRIASGSLDPKKELDLIALFIGGSKECGKQSIIWDHRRWIFRHCFQHVRHSGVELTYVESPGWATSGEVSFLPIIPLDVLQNECQLLRRSCELYPRNYHAWTHYHWILNVAVVAAGKDIRPMEVGVEDYRRFLGQEVIQLREWIARHVSDYSAVHLLCTLAIVGRNGASWLSESGVDELRDHALSLVLSYPTHEALWLYLRNILSFSPSAVVRQVVDDVRSRADIPVDMIERYILNLI